MNMMHNRNAAIAGFTDHYWADEEPSWSRDPWNGNTSAQCGHCGAWLELVRPGKHQCGACEWIEQKEQE